MPELAWDTRSFLLGGQPTGRLSENFTRDGITQDLAASLVTQVMTSVALPLDQGDLISNLSFLSGATAAAAPTNWWFALYTPAGVLIGQTADQLATAWAADLVKTLALAVAYNVPVRGVYFAAIMMKATTVVTLMGKSVGRPSAAGPILAGQVALSQTSGAALTTTAPATIVTPTAQAVIPYVVAT